MAESQCLPSGRRRDVSHRPSLRISIHGASSSAKLKVETVADTAPRDVTVTLIARPGLEIVPFEALGRALTPDQESFRKSWLSSKARRPLPELRRYCAAGVTVPFEYNFCPNDGKPAQIIPPSTDGPR